MPDFSALLRWLHAAGLLNSAQVTDLQRQWGDSTSARRVTEALRDLRENLRKQVLRWEDGDNIHHSLIEELNRLMAEHPMRTRLGGYGRKPTTQLYFELQSPEGLLAPLAYSGAMLFAAENRKRVRKCNRCVLHFLDTSKKGTRRWCSMQLCGNRLKVAAYAARKRFVDVD